MSNSYITIWDKFSITHKLNTEQESHLMNLRDTSETTEELINSINSSVILTQEQKKSIVHFYLHDAFNCD